MFNPLKVILGNIINNTSYEYELIWYNVVILIFYLFYPLKM